MVLTVTGDAAGTMNRNMTLGEGVGRVATVFAPSGLSQLEIDKSAVAMGWVFTRCGLAGGGALPSNPSP